jgi:hypothetical protein
MSDLRKYLNILNESFVKENEVKEDETKEVAEETDEAEENDEQIDEAEMHRFKELSGMKQSIYPAKDEMHTEKSWCEMGNKTDAPVTFGDDEIYEEDDEELEEKKGVIGVGNHRDLSMADKLDRKGVKGGDTGKFIPRDREEKEDKYAAMAKARGMKESKIIRSIAEAVLSGEKRFVLEGKSFPIRMTEAQAKKILGK